LALGAYCYLQSQTSNPNAGNQHRKNLEMVVSPMPLEFKGADEHGSDEEK